MQWWGSRRKFSNWGFRIYKNLNLGGGWHTHETKRDVEKIGFCFNCFENGRFGLLSLFNLSKKHMLVTCSRIPSNITAKVTLGAKCVWG